MATFEALAPRLEIYSIDEAFLDVTGIDACKPLLDFGYRVRATVAQQTGLMCGIGIAQTRTLAKLANHAAKTWPGTGGVVDLSDRQRQRKLMALIPIEEMWGIARKLAAKLRVMGIETELLLADANLQNAPPKSCGRNSSIAATSAYLCA